MTVNDGECRWVPVNAGDCGDLVAGAPSVRGARGGRRSEKWLPTVSRTRYRQAMSSFFQIYE
jgi:hypothetical protein